MSGASRKGCGSARLRAGESVAQRLPPHTQHLPHRLRPAALLPALSPSPHLQSPRRQPRCRSRGGAHRLAQGAKARRESGRGGGDAAAVQVRGGRRRVGHVDEPVAYVWLTLEPVGPPPPSPRAGAGRCALAEQVGHLAAGGSHKRLGRAGVPRAALKVHDGLWRSGGGGREVARGAIGTGGWRGSASAGRMPDRRDPPQRRGTCGAQAEDVSWTRPRDDAVRGLPAGQARRTFGRSPPRGRAGLRPPAPRRRLP